MNEYILEIDLPLYLDQEFMSLIPAQRQQVNKLMADGVISGYSLSMDRSKLWVTLRAASEEEVQKVFESFPLFEYMQGAIIPLMFHQSLTIGLPQLSMN